MIKRIKKNKKTKKVTEKVINRTKQDEMIHFVATHSIEKALNKLNTTKA